MKQDGRNFCNLAGIEAGRGFKSRPVENTKIPPLGSQSIKVTLRNEPFWGRKVIMPGTHSDCAKRLLCLPLTPKSGLRASTKIKQTSISVQKKIRLTSTFPTQRDELNQRVSTIGKLQKMMFF